MTGKDIDFEGSATAARRAARILGAEVMIPSPREPSPMTGTIAFVDADGVDRSLDFIEAPRGLDVEDVRDTAVRVELIMPSRAAPVTLWVMHPERCMESRTYNPSLPTSRETPMIRELPNPEGAKDSQTGRTDFRGWGTVSTAAVSVRHWRTNWRTEGRKLLSERRRRADFLLYNRKRPGGEPGRFWGYYREERYVSLYMWIRGR